jgi:hypothetical protein
MTAASTQKWLAGPTAAMLVLLVAGLAPSSALGDTPSADKDAVIAENLSEMLRDARTVISDNEALINDPALGDKHLTGQKVLADAIKRYQRTTGIDPTTIDPASRKGRLMRAMMNAIVAVMDDNQMTINEKGIGFKGLIPAVFGRLVSESFNGLAKGEAEIKVTAPLDLVQPYSATVDIDGRMAYRIAVPEYYTQSCLACHGTPKGELDITGYPKEGRKLGDLGGVMSITLFR